MTLAKYNRLQHHVARVWLMKGSHSSKLFVPSGCLGTDANSSRYLVGSAILHVGINYTSQCISHAAECSPLSTCGPGVVY
jgi:hypothetical protein